jgi:glycosyltransferase involved in cell wall biosynthesis
VLIVLAKAISRARILVHFRGWDESFLDSLLAGGQGASWVLWCLYRADHFIVLGNRFQSQLIDIGIPSAKITVIPEMIDMLKYSPLPKQAKKRPDEKVNFLFLSRLYRTKGAELVVEAVGHLVDDGKTNIHATIAGTGEVEEALHNRVEALGLGSYVNLLGAVVGKEKIDLFKSADVFLFPSTHPEGFPIAVLEALAAGLPILFTDVGSLTEHFGPDNGVLIDVNQLSIETLGNAMRRSMHFDFDVYSHRNQSAAVPFDASRVVPLYATLYRSLIEGQS